MRHLVLHIGTKNDQNTGVILLGKHSSAVRPAQPGHWRSMLPLRQPVEGTGGVSQKWTAWTCLIVKLVVCHAAHCDSLARQS